MIALRPLPVALGKYTCQPHHGRVKYYRPPLHACLLSLSGGGTSRRRSVYWAEDRLVQQFHSGWCLKTCSYQKSQRQKSEVVTAESAEIQGRPTCLDAVSWILLRWGDNVCKYVPCGRSRPFHHGGVVRDSVYITMFRGKTSKGGKQEKKKGRIALLGPTRVPRPQPLQRDAARLNQKIYHFCRPERSMQMQCRSDESSLVALCNSGLASRSE